MCKYVFTPGIYIQWKRKPIKLHSLLRNENLDHYQVGLDYSECFPMRYMCVQYRYYVYSMCIMCNVHIEVYTGQFNFIILEIKGLLKIQIECDIKYIIWIFQAKKMYTHISRILSYKQTKLLFRLTGGRSKKFSLLRNRIQFHFIEIKIGIQRATNR